MMDLLIQNLSQQRIFRVLKSRTGGKALIRCTSPLWNQFLIWVWEIHLLSLKIFLLDKATSRLLLLLLVRAGAIACNYNLFFLYSWLFIVSLCSYFPFSFPSFITTAGHCRWLSSTASFWKQLRTASSHLKDSCALRWLWLLCLSFVRNVQNDS